MLLTRPLTCIGFHTFTMFILLTSFELAEILNYFKAYCKENTNLKILGYDREGKKVLEDQRYASVWKTHYPHPHKFLGLKWTFVFDLNIPRPYNCIIAVRVTPNVLIGYDDMITISNESDIPAIEKTYHSFVGTIVPNRRLWKHLSFAAYKISRLDICGNFDLVETGYGCTVKQKRKILKQALIPSDDYKEPIVFDKVQRRWGTYWNSFYAKSKSVKINFYGKQYQLMEEFPNRLDDIKRAENLFRCEIQCGKQKMAFFRKEEERKLSYDERFRDYAVTKRLLSDEFTKSILESYFKRMLMTGNFYTMDDAIKNIGSFVSRQNRNERLINVLKLVDEHGGINNAKVYLEKNQGNTKEFIDSAKELIEHGINPVTTPIRVGHLPNLITAYEDMKQPISMLRIGGIICDNSREMADTVYSGNNDCP